MHTNVLVALVGTAALLAVSWPGHAQIAIPNVNTGTKSNIPEITISPTVRIPDGMPPAPSPNPDRQRPLLSDQRCNQLTDAQRRETPGCQ